MGKLLKSVDGNLVEISCEKKAETEAALLINDGTEEVWIPKSQIEEIEDEDKEVMTIYIPEWLATENNLI